MKTGFRSLQNLAILASITVLCFFNDTTFATTYDLKGDWSDLANPNGVWGFFVDSQLMTAQDLQGVHTDYPQPAWAPNDGYYIPYWRLVARSDTPSGWDTQPGDIEAHSPNWNSHYLNTRVVWTSPSAGFIDISGGVWFAYEQLNRYASWELLLNDTLLANGTVSRGDPWSRSNPLDFSQAQLEVSAGDEVALRFLRANNNWGAPVGVNLMIELYEAQAVPDGGYSAALLLLGLIGCMAGRRFGHSYRTGRR